MKIALFDGIESDIIDAMFQLLKPSRKSLTIIFRVKIGMRYVASLNWYQST